MVPKTRTAFKLKARIKQYYLERKHENKIFGSLDDFSQRYKNRIYLFDSWWGSR